MKAAKARESKARMRFAENDSKVSKPFEIPDDIRTELIRIGTSRSVLPGTIIFRRGQEPGGVFLVLEGRVALSSGEDPVRITRVAERGSLLGLPATIRNKPYSLTAEAVTDLQLCHVPPSQFCQQLTTNASLGLTVVNMLAEEISILRKLAVYKV